MQTVGIRELKARLSHYVRLAREGERIVITDRGRQVAVLAPVTVEHPGLQELIDKGMVRWSGGKPTGAHRRKLRGEPLSKTILDMRDESPG
jgi:prevent-host-death family protein